MYIPTSILKAFTSSILIIFCSIYISAQIPTGYYSAAEMKSGAQLKTALHNIIKVGTRLSYGSGSNATWSGFEKSDLHPDGHVWDMYSNNKYYFPGNGKAPGGMNIEHSFAKSWWGGSKNDAYKDLYHLNPSYSQANSARSSYPPGEVKIGSGSTTGTIKVGKNSYGSYTGMCFEPEDQYKGDFARAYMYMLVCYENLNLTSSENAKSAIQSDPILKYTFKPWFKDLMLKWHRQDPVSQKEINRQYEIHLLQNNRNPFIDYPTLAEYIWGNLAGQIWTSSGSVTDPYLITPYDGSTYNIVSTPVLTSNSDTIYVKGINLTSDLTVSISGTNANEFVSSNATVSKASAESTNGAMVIIHFTPTALNERSAVFTISGGGIAKDINVNLKGKGTNEFKAVDASNITENGFTANWSMDFGASDYALTVFRYIDNGSVGNIEIFNTDFANDQLNDGLRKTNGYMAFSDGALKMGSGSQGCEISFPTLDLQSQNINLIINAEQYNNDNDAKISTYVNGIKAGEITTDNTLKEHSLNIGSFSDNSTLTISTSKGKRVLIKNIRIVNQGNILSRDTLAGYPVLTGDVRSYDVSTTDTSYNYYYNVTSIGGSGSTTNDIIVKYTGSTPPPTTNNENTESQELEIYHSGTNFIIKGIEENSSIYLYSINGHILQHTSASGSLSIDLGNYARGVYIIRVIGKSNAQSIKVIGGQ